MSAENVENNEQDRLPHAEKESELHAEIARLNQALQEAQAKADENWERLLRKEAELQNIQRRSQQDIENTRKLAIERFAGELLEVLDSLERGLTFSAEDALEGMRLTLSIFLNSLDKQGIKPISPEVGHAFDPTYHEAISMQQTKDVPPNCIMTVVQKGYILHHRLLRPARVVVSKAPLE